MPSSSDVPGDSLPSVLLVAAGVLAPLVLVQTTSDLLALYLSGETFTAIAAVVYAIVAWWFLEAVDPDYRDYLPAAIGVPALLFFVAPPLYLTGRGEVTLDYLATGSVVVDGYGVVSGLFFYVVAFAVAGVVATQFSKKAHEYAQRSDRRPTARTLATGAVAVVALALLGVVVVNQTAAGSVAVTGVEMNDERVDWSTHTLAVELDGSPAELRVVVTDPLGDRTVQRVPRSALADGTETVRFRTRLDGQPRGIAVANGEYHVEVTTVTGTTVAEHRYTFDGLPPLSASVVDVAVDGPVAWNGRPVQVVEGNPASGTVAVVVENPESVRVPVRVELRRPSGESFDAYVLDTPPTERVGVVLSLRPEEVERLHERTDGRAVVVVRRGEQPVARIPVTIPPPAWANASG
jgi:hypothetical protein